ncbi:MAG: AAA family ATPase [Ferrimicrobium sp.]
MRLTHIEITNLLSFGPTTERIDFDDKLTVLVGPNGGGKTNVLRAIELVHRVIAGYAKPPAVGYYTVEFDSDVDVPPHHSHPNDSSEVRLGVSFNSEEEFDLIALFVRGAMVSSYLNLPNRQDSDHENVYQRAQPLAKEFAALLRQGTIVMRHDRTSDSNWSLEYVFKGPDEVEYSYALSWSRLLNGATGGELHRATEQTFQPNLGAQELKDKLGADVDVDDRTWQLSDILPGSGERVYVGVKNEIIATVQLRSDLLRSGIIDNTKATMQHRFGKVLNLILARTLVSDVVDRELGAPELFPDAPPVATSPSRESSMNGYLQNLWQWKVGSLDDRKRFSRAQGIFNDLRGKRETFDIRLNQHSQPTIGSQGQVDVNIAYWNALAPVIVSADGNFEVEANFAGSGAAELVRLSTHLAVEESSVVLLDEPAARLHPTAQAKLLTHLEQGDAQSIVITHSPGLLPHTNDFIAGTKRIALEKSGSSRVSSGSRDNADFGPLEKVIQMDPAVRSIPFAEAVVFVSGQTELVTFPYWYQAWLENKEGEAAPAEQSESVNSELRIHFCNFNGDSSFGNYLRLAVAFGVPWVVIADGASLAPVPQGVNARSTLISNQIDSVFTEFNREEAPSSNLALEESLEVDAGWFEFWQKDLLKSGVFTFANCWKKKESKTETCKVDKCDKVSKTSTGSCDSPDWHLNHIESFEDFAAHDPELKIIYQQIKDEMGKPHVGRRLLELHPGCPESIATMFQQIIDSQGPLTL